MAAIIQDMPVSDDKFEDDCEEWEQAVSLFKFDSKKESLEPITALRKTITKEEKNATKCSSKNIEIYRNYGYFVHGLIGTISRTFFSIVDLPEGKKTIREKLSSSEISLETYVM